MQPIYFIASYPRSGNTWVRALIFELLRRQGIYVGMPKDLRPMDYRLPSDVNPGYYSRITGLEPKDITPEIAAAARAGVHQLIAERATETPFVKTHAAYAFFQGHPTINVRVARGGVYLVRNPLDVAKSLSNFLGMTLTDTVGFMQLDAAVMPGGEDSIWDPWSSWGSNVRSWLGAQNFPVLVVRYEDLRADTAFWLGKIAAHAGISAPAADVRAVSQELTLDAMKSMVESEKLAVPIKNKLATFVGSQLVATSEGSDDALLPLQSYAADLRKHLRYD